MRGSWVIGVPIGLALKVKVVRCDKLHFLTVREVFLWQRSLVMLHSRLVRCWHIFCNELSQYEFSLDSPPLEGVWLGMQDMIFRDCYHMTVTWTVFLQSSVYGADSADVGRAYKPPGSQRCHLAGQVCTWCVCVCVCVCVSRV